MVLAMVMVLATTLTAFAAPNTESPYTSKIKVTGLSSREETTVKLYKVVSFDEANSKWVVADWATADVDTTKNPFVIDWEALNWNYNRRLYAYNRAGRKRIYDFC